MTSTSKTQQMTLTPSDCPISLNKELEIINGTSSSINQLRGMQVLSIDNKPTPTSARAAEKLLTPGVELELTKGRIPVTVLSGFLGSGKTTLMNVMLRKNELSDQPKQLAIIVNDMSTINIDSDMIERRDEEMIELHNGCICCTLRGDLIKSITLLVKEKNPDCIIIESTGIGEVLPIAITFSTGVDESTNVALRSIVRLDNLVTVVDAESFSNFFDNDDPTNFQSCETEAATSSTSLRDLLCSQIMYANTVVVTKLDKITSPSSTTSAITSLVRYLNPTATIFPIPKDEIPLTSLIHTHLYNEAAYANTPEWEAEQKAVHVPELEQYGISSFSFSKIGDESRPFNSQRFKELIDSRDFAKGVLRAKGCFYQTDKPGMRWNIHLTPSGVKNRVSISSDTRWRVEEQQKLLYLGSDISGPAMRLLESVENEINRLKERGAWSDEKGDKRIELVFIGRPSKGFNEATICSMLEQALEPV